MQSFSNTGSISMPDDVAVAGTGDVSHWKRGNLLLELLTEEEWQLLQPRLERVELHAGELLQAQGSPPPTLRFQSPLWCRLRCSTSRKVSKWR